MSADSVHSVPPRNTLGATYAVLLFLLGVFLTVVTAWYYHPALWQESRIPGLVVFCGAYGLHLLAAMLTMRSEGYLFLVNMLALLTMVTGVFTCKVTFSQMQALEEARLAGSKMLICGPPLVMLTIPVMYGSGILAMVISSVWGSSASSPDRQVPSGGAWHPNN